MRFKKAVQTYSNSINSTNSFLALTKLRCIAYKNTLCSALDKAVSAYIFVADFFHRIFTR